MAEINVRAAIGSSDGLTAAKLQSLDFTPVVDLRANDPNPTFINRVADVGKAVGKVGGQVVKSVGQVLSPKGQTVTVSADKPLRLRTSDSSKTVELPVGSRVVFIDSQNRRVGEILTVEAGKKVTLPARASKVLVGSDTDFVGDFYTKLDNWTSVDNGRSKPLANGRPQVPGPSLRERMAALKLPKNVLAGAKLPNIFAARPTSVEVGAKVRVNGGVKELTPGLKIYTFDVRQHILWKLDGSHPFSKSRTTDLNS